MGPGSPGSARNFAAVRNFECDQGLTKELGVSAPTTPDEWEEQIRSNVRRGFQADWLDRKYIPPDWNKVYPSIGGPPVWSTENIQGYNDLLDTFTQMLEPRDLTELIWTKEATDATWEASRAAREKNRVPERRYQKQIREAAQHQRRADAAEALLARPATALSHSLGLEAGFKYHQALDMAQSRLNKRRDNALRQLALWRRGLGAKARALSDRFIAEQFLAERYGADQFVADAQIEASTGQPFEADQPLAVPRAAAEVAPPLAPTQEVAPLAPALASADETAEGAPPPGSAGEATQTAPSLAAPVVSTNATVETAAPSPLTSLATSAPPLVSAAGDAPEAPGVLTCIREAAEAAPRPPASVRHCGSCAPWASCATCTLGRSQRRGYGSRAPNRLRDASSRTRSPARSRRRRAQWGFAMSSEKQVAANRRNGLKSQGPRTAAGKGVSSRNALRHGLATISRDNPAFTATVEAIAPEKNLPGHPQSHAVRAGPDHRRDHVRVGVCTGGAHRPNRAPD